MKKLIALLLSVCVCLSLAGCELEDSPRKENTSNPSSATNAKQTFGLNETAVFQDLKFTATEIKQSSGENFFEPEDGNVFVGIKFTIENISDEEQIISTLLLFEGYADDIKCPYSFSAACVFDEGTLDGTIAPGKKLIGWYAIEVPRNWQSIDLMVSSTWTSSKSANFVFENK